MRKLILAAALALSACATATAPPAPPEVASQAQALAAAIESDLRSQDHRARDQFRHPQEALQFWNLQPGMTIVEIEPGGEAWWTEILAPFAAQTGGRYFGAYADLANPAVTQAAVNARATFTAKLASDPRYGAASAVDFGMHSGLSLPDHSADFVLVARAFHNWARRDGMTDRYLAEIARVLKPGGILAVEQHRAPDGLDVAATASTGYVPEAYVIGAARRAGLEVMARSEINANPRDDRDHPFGVWTLPPVRRSSPFGAPDDPLFDRAPYDAIGESDRMTLMFMKPDE